MYVGEVAHLSAEITYCSEHSLEVKVYVEAENLFSGQDIYFLCRLFWHACYICISTLCFAFLDCT